jgi:hypothetical protein
LYPQLAVSKVVTFGVRGEYFTYKNGGGNVTGITISSNIRAGAITLIPEIRFDNKSSAFPVSFIDSNLVPTNSATQFLIAAVYAF